jgi:hypothetical protein
MFYKTSKRKRVLLPAFLAVAAMGTAALAGVLSVPRLTRAACDTPACYTSVACVTGSQMGGTCQVNGNFSGGQVSLPTQCVGDSESGNWCGLLYVNGQQTTTKCGGPLSVAGCATNN